MNLGSRGKKCGVCLTWQTAGLEESEVTQSCPSWLWLKSEVDLGGEMWTPEVFALVHSSHSSYSHVSYIKSISSLGL